MTLDDKTKALIEAVKKFKAYMEGDEPGVTYENPMDEMFAALKSFEQPKYEPSGDAEVTTMPTDQQMKLHSSAPPALQEVVEKVARAIFYADDDKDGYDWKDNYPNKNSAENMREWHRDLARAAIAALREFGWKEPK